jgi:hypothetical protein
VTYAVTRWPASSVRHDDVEVTAPELGVDDVRGKRQRLGRDRVLVGRREANVLGARPRDDRRRRRRECVDVAGYRLLVDCPRLIEALEHEPVRHSDEAGDVLARGLLENLLRRRELLDLAGAHDGEAVTERERLDLVVRDVHGGEAEPPMELVDLGADLVAQSRVEVRQWLVEQHELRASDEPARKRDALLLTTAQLRRVSVEQRRGIDERGDLFDPLLRLRPPDPPRRERVADVLAHRHVRPQRVRLEDHSDVPFVRRDVRAPRGVEDRAVAERDRALFGRLEAGDAAKRGGLAAPARPQQDEEFAGLDLEVEAVDRDRRCLAAEPLGQATNAYVGH